ncbi:hypothetical protein B0J13DRAFT_125286 [Dactylonectria estremocensis]|uniref:Uncharacterized protein n=1 Tax=Dactylonectria estremocensis TaxID=1079267 RepID=A0A9P9FF13_9HYPO|nr:hypothetical protein B0J13DRAFT_125286 [Dactylonectria estremocensis]
MRGLTKAAAFLLAPALARASSMSLDESWTVVDLDIPTGNHDVDSMTLRLNIQETDEICGPTKLLINGHYLEQNEDGFGSGVVPVGEDVLMTAHWLFSCVTANNGPAAKLMRFTIDKLDGEPTSDLDFAMTFRQTSPAIVLELGGAAVAAAVVEPWIPNESADQQRPAEEMPDPDDELEAQIQELELLRVQVDDLMDLIHVKEMAIRERFENQGDHGPPRPPPPPPIFIMLQDCNSVQCVVRALTDKVKHTAGHFYGDFFKPGHGPPLDKSLSTALASPMEDSLIVEMVVTTNPRAFLVTTRDRSRRRLLHSALLATALLDPLLLTTDLLLLRMANALLSAMAIVPSRLTTTTTCRPLLSMASILTSQDMATILLPP